MVNIAVEPLSDHVGYHLLHWLISQSGAWYSKVNENLQDNLRSLETGVAVIDDILTPKEEEISFENQQNVEVEEQFYHQNSDDHHLNILNQIINMNINYNHENNLEHRGIRGNVQPGQFISYFVFILLRNLCHMLDIRAEFSNILNSPTLPFIDFFLVCEKMDNFKFFFK